jgi:hypothetical protein
MSYNTELQENNAELQEILRTVNSLPNASGSSGGGVKWEVIAEGELTEETTSIRINTDTNGDTFELALCSFGILVKPTATNSGNGALQFRTNSDSNANGGTVNIVNGIRNASIAEHQIFIYSSLCLAYTGWASSAGSAIGGQNTKFPTLTAIILNGTDSGKQTFGVGTKWVLRGVRA